VTNDQILELAGGIFRFDSTDELITFANAIAQRTRDECAAVCDDLQHERGSTCAEYLRSMTMDYVAALKAQVGEPSMVDSHWPNIKMDVSHPTTERRVMELVGHFICDAHGVWERMGVSSQEEWDAAQLEYAECDRSDAELVPLYRLNAAPKGEV
jgi:hypothetical protein